MYWWYVVHLWVEGVWELVMASILAFLMIKLTGVDREVIEKWLYVIVGLALFSGLPRHRPPLLLDRRARLLAVDRLASSRRWRSLPFFAMVMFAFYMVWKGGAIIRTRPRCCGRSAAAVMAFFGAGVWGFLHTLSLDQLLHPRHAGDRGARPSRLLRRLCDAQPGDHHLRHAHTCAIVRPTTRCSTC